MNRVGLSAAEAHGALETLATAVVILDRELRVRYLNPAAEMLLSQSARKAVGLSIDVLLPAGDGLTAALARARDEGQSYTERELHLMLPGGREAAVDWTVTPYAEPGVEAGLMLELHPLDRLLRITREEQRLAQSEVTRALVRALAHEIKNPLGGLRGAAQLLERAVPDEGLKEYTEVIISEADRLQSLVDRMLGPREAPESRPVNIHRVLERVRQLVAAESPPGIEIERDYDPSIPELHGDADMLIQAVLNIARNAVEALGEAGRITLRTRALRQYTIGQVRHRLVVRVDIIDNGPGIPREMVDRIFYPMMSGRAEGTGLGLSIAQSLVSRQGGLIECESRPGHTEFSLFLPLEPKHEHATPGHDLGHR